MKARIKATEEELEVHLVDKQARYIGSDGVTYWEEDLDFGIEDNTPDYWTHLEHQYAGMAMQGILSNEDMQKELMRVFGKEEAIEDTIVDYAKDMAQLLVKKMKEEMK